MIDINGIRDSMIAANGLSEVDGCYTFYYDETNNVRKLHLTPGGMNILAPDCFVLGGVVHSGSPKPIDLAALRTALRLQPSVKELKLKHLGQGDFPTLLGSPKVQTLLEWLTAQGFFLHYQVVDLLYWSIVDIVDSILTEAGEPQLLIAHRMLKDGLYTVLRGDVAGTAEMLGRYNYPDVGRARRRAFIAELRDLVEHRGDMLEHVPFYMLKGMLQIAQGLEALPYLEDEAPNVLIDSFGPFFMSRLCLFKNAQHILDEERHIEAYISSLQLTDRAEPLRHYRFANSKTEPGVQISDPVAGLLGKLFTYVNRTPLRDLEADMANFTDQQRGNLTLLARQLDASTDECPAFAQYVISAEDQQRASILLAVDAFG